MLTKIREKAQGAFAWGIILLIAVPFALWGIQNYTGTSQETPVASVGSKDFFQQDLNKAYEQYSQNFQGLNIDEQVLKTEALKKLIKDEALLQYVQSKALAASDENTRDFIKTLPYFQIDGKFSETQYKSMLAAQRMSSPEFVNRVRSALIMEQFQHTVTDSSFATNYDVESFFRIQNQQRGIKYLTVALPKLNEQPTEAEQQAFYQEHQELFKLPDQVSVDYLELALDDIAKTVEVNDEKLKAYYQEQKALYATPERRKVSHILISITDKQDATAALAKAQEAKKQLQNKDFAALAAELSDDQASAKSGGDLGFINPGDLEKSFEDVALTLKSGEISEPVRSSFGYHLIKLTQLIPGEIKPFEAVKDELTKTYQKTQAENQFYQSGETLAQMSYENPDSLQTASDALGLSIKQTALFTRENGDGIASNPKVRDAAFSDDVLQGNNSSPVELAGDKVVVLHLHERKEATVKPFAEVKQEVISAILKQKAKQQADDTVIKIKARLLAGESIDAVATEQKLDVQTIENLVRTNPAFPLSVREAIFKAPKPQGDKPSIFTAEFSPNEKIVISLYLVKEGEMSEAEKKQMGDIRKKMSAAFGQADLNMLMESLLAEADVKIASAEK